MDETALLAYLEQHCPYLSESVSQMPADTRKQLIIEVLDSSNPKSAAQRLDDLLHETTGHLTATLLVNHSIRAALVGILGSSNYLFSVIRRNPSLLESMFLQGQYFVKKTRAIQEDELEKRNVGVQDVAEFDKVLRLYKEEEYLRIGCRDLIGLAHTQEVMAELSDLACACTQAALTFHHNNMLLRHGNPEKLDGSIGIVVIGMGKISGRELNFSSDVDLIFVRGIEEGSTSGPKIISVKQFYETLVHKVTRSLSDVTEDGFVFRIDLRLRPEGEKGELVPSVPNALDYYLSWGRTWERAVLMKAVPIAGDLDLGREFVQELEPFIYKKHLDYSTLEEMRLIKLRIEKSLKRKPGLNIKLGQGGIREIEFFVQALQLINAGRIRRVRTPSTLEALRLLSETGLLEKSISEDLTEAYLFFRKTEHRIQMNYQLQTHELPRSEEEQEELALRMGYRKDAVKLFQEDLENRRRFVEELFSSMFYHSGDEILQQVSSETRSFIDSIHDEHVSYSMLTAQGFENPEQSYQILKNLVQPSEGKGVTEKGKQLLERLAPLFIEELLKVPEPGKTLVTLDSYINSLHSGSAYFSTFMENPAIVRLLVKILGESRFFAELLLRHPQAIDSLIATGARARSHEKRFLESELSERLVYCEDFESELDILRRFKNEEILVTGVRHLWGETDSQAARGIISNLAEVCLNAAVDIAAKEMVRKFGPENVPDSLPFVILGMGKLGGMEMTYLSDLDVIFIYDHACDKVGRLEAREWFTRMASRIISILSVPTAEGIVFNMDTRLRPSGNTGPLVSSMTAFRDYHSTASKLWERQALIKARPVIGPAALTEEVSGVIKDFLIRTEASDKDLNEIKGLRKRMEQELALEDKLHVDLKTGHGGLVDVEFFVQGNLLKHASRWPEILCTNTLEAIAALHKTGLLDLEAFDILDSGYRFLTNLEDRLRLMENRSVDRIPLGGDKFKGLARRLGYMHGQEEKLLEDYFRVTGAIRKIYSSFFGADDQETRVS